MTIDNKLFYKLPLPHIRTVQDIHLNPYFYEKAMVNASGFRDLNSPGKKYFDMSKEEKQRYLDLVPGFELRSEFDIEKKGKVFTRFQGIDRPCSMIVKDMEHLLKIAVQVYQVSYANYILGSNEQIGYPDIKCGWSAMNLVVSLMIHGYPNAVYLSDAPGEHGYAGLPFVVENSDKKGFILADPTSDQLWLSPIKPKNLVWIVLGGTWKYETEWYFDKDLYPTLSVHIGTMKEFKQIPDKTKYWTRMSEFVRKAFSKSIELNKFPSIDELKNM